jgi:putative mRNA 3-end processing factor
MNQVFETETSLECNAEVVDTDRFDEKSVFGGPSSTLKQGSLQQLIRRISGTTAGFSGWAVNGYGYRSYDRAFPFSDHCDFNDLVELVEAVDPERVYTHHGFDEAFASYLSKELGFNARALKNNQSSLTDF